MLHGVQQRTHLSPHISAIPPSVPPKYLSTVNCYFSSIHLSSGHPPRLNMSIISKSFATILCVAAVSCAPIRHMPEELKAGYTMDGRLPIGEYFVDDTGEDGKGTHYKYKREHVIGFVKEAERMVGKPVQLQRDNAKRTWLFEALKQHPIAKGSRGAVYGSIEPWYEAIALAHGAESVVTVEYNELTYDWPGMSTVTVAQCAKELAEGGYKDCGNFDFAFSMSSFDHDGLGRYGDPLNPNGDIEAMKSTLAQLRPGGILYLTLPIGPDVVVWNLHRRYGELRLPLMLEGWELLGRIPWEEKRLTAEASFSVTYEPVFVLRKPEVESEL